MLAHMFWAETLEDGWAGVDALLAPAAPDDPAAELGDPTRPARAAALASATTDVVIVDG